jgi:hypothetical protein
MALQGSQRLCLQGRRLFEAPGAPPTPSTLPNFLENRLISCRFRCVGGVGGIERRRAIPLLGLKRRSFGRSVSPVLKLKRNADNSEWMEKEFIAAGLTLVGGLILFTLSQAVLKLLDPCVEFKKYIAKIGADLDFYHEYKYASIADLMNAALAFRKHASALEEHFNSIFQYEYFADLLGLPSERQLSEAGRELLRLADMYAESTKSNKDLTKLAFVNELYRHTRIREHLRIRRICAPEWREYRSAEPI